MPRSHAKPPLFVVVEPTGAAAQSPAKRLSWACAAEAGAARSGLPRAAARIARLAETHAVHLADPLFDAPRLEALLAAAGIPPPPEMRDWLMALAPFRQARHLAAMLEAADARADPDNPASRLYETWREAQARAESGAQTRR